MQLQRVNVTLFLQDEDTQCAINAVTCIYHACNHMNPDITSKMVEFGCVSPFLNILTKQNSTDKQKLEAVDAIYFIKDCFKDALKEADDLVEAIANLQVFHSFDDSSCFVSQIVTPCAD